MCVCVCICFGTLVLVFQQKHIFRSTGERKKLNASDTFSDLLVITNASDTFSDLLVITVATAETDGFRQFVRSTKKYGLNLKVQF